MAQQPCTEHNDLCDIRLLFKAEEKEQYTCGICHNLAINTKALVCEEKYHEQDTRFYCGSCAKSIVSSNECPNTHHSNPVFSEQKVVQAKLQRNIQFICPYSAQLNPRAAFGAHAVEDTMEGKPKHHEIACRWKGTYLQLKHHVLHCRFKPRENRSVVELQTKVRHLETNNHELRKKIKVVKEQMEGITQQCNDLQQSIEVNRDEISNKMNRDEIKDNVPLPVITQQNQSSAIWILGALIVVNWAILAYYVCKHNTDILGTPQKYNGLVSNKSNIQIYNYSAATNDMNSTINTLGIRLIELKENMTKRWEVDAHAYNYSDALNHMNWTINTLKNNTNIKFNYLTDSYQALKNQLMEMMTNLSERCEPENAFKESIQLLAAKEASEVKKVPEHKYHEISIWRRSLAWIQWISYYCIKLISQFGSLLFIGISFVCKEDEWWIAVILSAVTHCITDTVFLYSTENWMILIDVAVIAMNTAFSWICRRMCPSVERPSRRSAAFLLIQSNILYWMLWHQDIVYHLPLIACFATILLLFGWIKELSPNSLSFGFGAVVLVTSAVMDITIVILIHFDINPVEYSVAGICVYGVSIVIGLVIYMISDLLKSYAYISEPEVPKFDDNSDSTDSEWDSNSD